MSGGNQAGGQPGAGMFGGGFSSTPQSYAAPTSFASPTQTPPTNYATNPQQPQPQPQAPAPTSPYAAWDPNTHYGTAGQMVSYGGKNYSSLGDMPNGQIGAGGGTWNENSRPDWTPLLWQEVPQQTQQPQPQPQQPVNPYRPPMTRTESFIGAAPEAWQFARGGIADLLKGRRT